MKDPQNRGRMFLQNADIHNQNYTVSQTRKLHSEYSTLGQPHILHTAFYMKRAQTVTKNMKGYSHSLGPY